MGSVPKGFPRVPLEAIRTVGINQVPPLASRRSECRLIGVDGARAVNNRVKVCRCLFRGVRIHHRLAEYPEVSPAPAGGQLAAHINAFAGAALPLLARDLH